MAWDFSTEPEFQRELDWMERFVREEIGPIDLLFEEPYNPGDLRAREATAPLKQQVKDRGLWACHLGPELGGRGYGQVRLGLMNEILGRSRWAPSVFGCQAPDSGNAEILAHASATPAYAPRRRRTRIPSNTVRVVCRMSPSMSSLARICPSIHNDASPCTALQAT